MFVQNLYEAMTQIEETKLNTVVILRKYFYRPQNLALSDYIFQKLHHIGSSPIKNSSDFENMALESLRLSFLINAMLRCLLY